LHPPGPVPRPARAARLPGDAGPEGRRAHGERAPLRPAGAVGAKRPCPSRHRRRRMEAPATGRLWALVLAGGDGTRLQALTRVIAGAPIPKQYCRITGDRSLLELTVARTSRIFPPSRTLVIVNRDHLPVARPQLRSLPVENVVVQPA